MSGIKIKGTGHCLPENIVTNDDFAKRIETSDEWISSRTGIRARRHCTTETHTELCLVAARMALADSGISPAQIGACIVATITPDWLTPAAACLVQRGLGLAENTICFDLNAACTGFLAGLHTMECLLAASPKKYGLVIGGEVLSRLLNYDDRATCVLFGDGAGAAVVEFSADYPSIGAQLGCRGDDRILLVEGPGVGEKSQISMEGTAVFKFAVESIPRCMNEVLAAHGCTQEDVDFFVFHQANARIIDLVVRKYHIPPEKYHKNLDAYGNTSAASIPILLSELAHQGKITAGSRVLCVGFGGGLTWGGAIVQFV